MRRRRRRRLAGWLLISDADLGPFISCQEWWRVLGIGDKNERERERDGGRNFPSTTTLLSPFLSLWEGEGLFAEACPRKDEKTFLISYYAQLRREAGNAIQTRSIHFLVVKGLSSGDFSTLESTFFEGEKSCWGG